LGGGCGGQPAPPLLQVPPVPSAQDPGHPVAVVDPVPPVDQEVSPPLAPADPAAPDGGSVDMPPVLPQVDAPFGTVAPEVPAAATQPDAAWSDHAGTGDDPLAASSTGMAPWAKPTLTYDHMARSLRPHWKKGHDQAVALAEDLFASTDTTITREDVILGVACMVAQRKDMAFCLHGWLRDRAGPEHDPRAVLDKLLNLLSTLKDVE